VVVHPPFTWQRDYARNFAGGLAKLQVRHPDITFAIENMYPVRMAGRTFVPYVPGWDPTGTGYAAYTLDVSHCAASRTDALAMADRMGAGLKHVHLGDGTGEGRDEHLVPGRGNQPCADLLRSLAGRGYRGSVAVEVSTRRVTSRYAREADLREALEFARRHLSPAPATTPV
jgi:sugar phosphate isomerase/epimerase